MKSTAGGWGGSRKRWIMRSVGECVCAWDGGTGGKRDFVERTYCRKNHKSDIKRNKLTVNQVEPNAISYNAFLRTTDTAFSTVTSTTSLPWSHIPVSSIKTFDKRIKEDYAVEKRKHITQQIDYWLLSLKKTFLGDLNLLLVLNHHFLHVCHWVLT